MAKKKKLVKKLTDKQLVRRLRDLLNAERQLNSKLYNENKNLQEQIPTPYFWTTGTGMHIQPRQMDDRHLQNAIFWAARTAFAQFGRATWLNLSFAKKIEGLHHLLVEAQRRGLEV